jgi:hypothetical protein
MGQLSPTKPRPKTCPWPRGGICLVTGTFPVLCFLYVWLRIEPALGYARSSPLFFLNRSFFNQHLNRPGGLVDYGAAFLAQFDYSDLAGALMFTILGCPRPKWCFTASTSSS